MEVDKPANHLVASEPQGDLKGIDAHVWPMTAWLDVLHAVLQPRGILLVGAGRGNGTWVRWLRTRNLVSGTVCVHVLEGDAQKYRHLQQGAGRDGWTLWQDVIAATPGAAIFHRTSNPAESSLLPINVQQALWPNLRDECAIAIDDAITLDIAFARAEGAVNWLLLDCLPAAALLQGGKQLLEGLDVALVRVASGLPNDALADPQAVGEMLENVGMRRIHSQSERHPALAHDLYVRDTAEQARQLLAAFGQAQRKARVLRSQLKSMQQEKLELEKKAESAATKTAYSDADIDDFLNDLSPFFSGRSVTYVDIGAFTGQIPLKIVSHGKIRVREAHLFEPNPESFKHLVESTKSLKVPKLHVYNYALGANESSLTFSAGKSMTKVVDSIGDPSGQSGLFQAEGKRLDSLKELFTDHHIDLLKIDVEGFEMKVIEGAKNFLREQRIDVIYIEAGFNKSGTQQSYFGDIDRMLQELGYRVFRIYEQRNEWISDSPLLRRCNVAYMSVRFAETNPYKANKEILQLRKEISLMKKENKNSTK